MTTRPPLGSQRPSQSSLIGNVQLGQKPQFHREFSSQNRRIETQVDSTLEGESPHGIPKSNRPRPPPSRTASNVASPNPTEDFPNHPRGKPRLHFDILDGKVEANDSKSPLNASHVQEGASQAPLPMPTRPKRRSRPVIQKQRAQPTVVAKKDARPKPWALEVPALAPHYPPNGEYQYASEPEAVAANKRNLGTSNINISQDMPISFPGWVIIQRTSSMTV